MRGLCLAMHLVVGRRRRERASLHGRALKEQYAVDLDRVGCEMCWCIGIEGRTNASSLSFLFLTLCLPASVQINCQSELAHSINSATQSRDLPQSWTSWLAIISAFFLFQNQSSMGWAWNFIPLHPWLLFLIVFLPLHTHSPLSSIVPDPEPVGRNSISWASEINPSDTTKFVNS